MQVVLQAVCCTVECFFPFDVGLFHIITACCISFFSTTGTTSGTSISFKQVITPGFLQPGICGVACFHLLGMGLFYIGKVFQTKGLDAMDCGRSINKDLDLGTDKVVGE